MTFMINHIMTRSGGSVAADASGPSCFARARARVYVRVHTGDIPTRCLLLFACVSPPWEETRNGEIHGIAIFASSINRNTRNTGEGLCF